MKNVLSKIYCFSRGGLLIVALWFLFAGCDPTNSDQEDHYKQLKIGITSTYQGEAATYVAMERGFFRDHGLNVTIKSNPSEKVSIQDLFNGVVQIAHVAEAPVVYSLLDTSYYSGVAPHFQVFADMIYSNKVQKIIARKDHGITEPLDIVGKKVALVRGTQLDYFFDSFLLEHQISNDEFEIVDMDPSEQLKAIKNGDIDVAVMWEPFASYIRYELGDNGVFLDTDLTYSTLWLSVTLDSYAKSNPDILVSYLKAMEVAQEYIRDNPDYTRELLSRKTNIPLEVIEPLWPEIDFDLSLSERMLTLLEDQARWIIRKNLADTSMQNMQQIINFSPMQEVNPHGITVIK